MEPVARLLISLVELAEVELATLKHSVIRLGLSLAMIVGAAVVGVAGVALVLVAAFLVLKGAIGLTGAFAVSGVLCLGVAVALVVLALKRKKPRSAVATVAAEPSAEPTNENSASLRIAS